MNENRVYRAAGGTLQLIYTNLLLGVAWFVMFEFTSSIILFLMFLCVMLCANVYVALGLVEGQ